MGLAEFGKNRRSLMIGEQSQTLSSRLHATFISLRNPNFRVYFAAQIGSNVGTWIQITAENWLILQLTDSGLALGITNALQFGPLVFLGLYGGVVADRFNRRRLLIISQSTLALLSAAIGLLVITDLIQFMDHLVCRSVAWVNNVYRSACPIRFH